MTAMGLANRLRKQLDRMDMNFIMGSATRDLVKVHKEQLVKQGNVWRGSSGGLMQTMAAKRRSRNSWDIIPLYAHALDHMRPHWIALKRGRKIRDWFRDKVLGGRAPSGGGDSYPGAIMVSPSFFMEAGDRQWIYLVNKYNLIEVHKAIARVGTR